MIIKTFMRYIFILTWMSFVFVSQAQNTDEPTATERGNIDIINFKDIFKIYPSAAQGYIVVDKLPENDNTIFIFNEIGQTAGKYEKLRGQQQIDISYLANGNYFIVLVAYGRVIYSVKFLKV
jgi:hypothetical protein